MHSKRDIRSVFDIRAWTLLTSARQITAFALLILPSNLLAFALGFSTLITG